jgi:hypothetical protein
MAQSKRVIDPRDTLREKHRRELIAEITEALDRGYAATAIGREILHDPSFVSKLFNGHGFRISTLIQARAKMHLYAKPRKPSVVTRSKPIPSLMSLPASKVLA